MVDFGAERGLVNNDEWQMNENDVGFAAIGKLNEIYAKYEDDPTRSASKEAAIRYFGLVQRYDYNVGYSEFSTLFDFGNVEGANEDAIDKATRDKVGKATKVLSGCFDTFLDPEVNYDFLVADIATGLTGLGKISAGPKTSKYGETLIVDPNHDSGYDKKYQSPDDFIAEGVRGFLLNIAHVDRLDLAGPLLEKIESMDDSLGVKINEPTRDNKEGYRNAQDRLRNIASDVAESYYYAVRSRSDSASVSEKTKMIDFVIKFGANDQQSLLERAYGMTFLSAKELANVDPTVREYIVNQREILHAKLESFGLFNVKASAVRTTGNLASVTEGSVAATVGVVRKFAETKFGSALINMLGQKNGEKAKNEEKRKNDFDGTTEDAVLEQARNRIKDGVHVDGELPADLSQTFETQDGKPRRMSVDELTKPRK